ncbi:hypothetical protein E2542_SST01826 [Spatholobus suberectus]|nr:hypothetical protein E2542_SST01826 [Spatholobus suberectus]
MSLPSIKVTLTFPFFPSFPTKLSFFDRAGVVVIDNDTFFVSNSSLIRPPLAMLCTQILTFKGFSLETVAFLILYPTGPSPGSSSLENWSLHGEVEGRANDDRCGAVAKEHLIDKRVEVSV